MSRSGDGYVDEDTARTIASGRQTLGSVLSSAQTHLQKVFIVFVIGLLATIFAMRTTVWPRLESNIRSNMDEQVGEAVEIIATTPFDVILLQVKIGLIVGVLVSIPVLLYLSRDSIRDREWYPEERIPIWKGAVLGTVGAALFVGGVAYGYYVFFPFMFSFLAENAVTAGIKPTYSIVEYTEFVLVLALSFGLAAELPLVMSGLAYSGIVRYETFRDKWRYAVVAIFGFGALFSPPDPFTMIMWAGPLLLLYAVSLYLTKVVVTAKRGREQVDIGGTAAAHWSRILGSALLAGVGTYAFFARGGLDYVNANVVPYYDPTIRWTPLAPVESMLGVSTMVTIALVSIGVALVAAVLAMLISVFVSLEVESEPARGRMGDPAAIDIGELDAGGVRAAPVEAFAGMTEDEALGHARTAMEADDPDRARAILDRFDEAEPLREPPEETTTDVDGDTTDVDGEAVAADAVDAAGAGGGGGGGTVQRTTAGMVNAFTDDETTEEDIGGWYYDFAFILDSLTSKMFRLVVVFILVMVSVFTFLYTGGIGRVRADFLSRLPPEVVQPEDMVVALHPVEVLVFEVKISTLLGAVAVLPLVLYYAWPAAKERGLVSGDRDVFFTWGIAMLVGLAVGTFVGYTFVAPTIISYLVYDAMQADMIISYRIKNFFWLIFLTTAGVGLLANIPMTMFLFQRGGIATFRTMRDRWREVSIAVFAVSAFLTPSNLYTMFLIAIPVIAAYGLGLALLWFATLGGRRERPPQADAT